MAVELLNRAPLDKDPQAPIWTRWRTLLVQAVNDLLTGTQTGMGDPNGVVTAPQGSLFRRTDGGTSTTLYEKTSGGTVTPTNTGWTVAGSGVAADAGTLTGTMLAANVVNSSLTSVGTLAALTVTAPIVGSVTGNAATATKLATARAINGVSFDGTAPITVTAAAATLTGGTTAWTPIDSSGAGLSLTVTSAVYQRVANWILFTCQVGYPVTASGANFTLGGLPVAAAAGVNTGVAVGLSNATVILDYVVLGGTTTISSRAPVSAAVGTNTQHSNAALILTGMYPV